MVHVGSSGVMYDGLEGLVLPRVQHIKICLISWEKHEVAVAVVDQSHALDVARKAPKAEARCSRSLSGPASFLACQSRRSHNTEPKEERNHLYVR